MRRWHLSKDLKEVTEQVLWTEHPQLKGRQGQAEPAWWWGEKQGEDEAGVGHVRERGGGCQVKR